MDEIKISGWVARDKGGGLYLHFGEPRRGVNEWHGGIYARRLLITAFPDLTWDSDPLPVEITIKRKKNG